MRDRGHCSDSTWGKQPVRLRTSKGALVVLAESTKVTHRLCKVDTEVTWSGTETTEMSQAEHPKAINYSSLKINKHSVLNFASNRCFICSDCLKYS